MSNPTHIELLNFVKESGYYSERQYIRVPEDTEVERIRKFALVLNDELLFKVKNSKSYEVRINDRNIADWPVSDIIRIITEATHIFKTKKYLFIGEVARHKARVKTQSSNPSYLFWKRTAFKIFSSHLYCFKCHVIENLEVDHIKPHNNFADKKLALDLKNSQLLCHFCNSQKGNLVVADYRTDEHKALVEAFLAE